MISVLGLAMMVLGVTTALGTFLQVRNILKTRSTNDVSLPFFELRAGQSSAALLFGVASGNVFLIVPNVVVILASVVMFIVVRHIH